MAGHTGRSPTLFPLSSLRHSDSGSMPAAGWADLRQLCINNPINRSTRHSRHCIVFRLSIADGVTDFLHLEFDDRSRQ